VGPTQAAGVRWSPTGEWILYAQASSTAGFSGPQHVVHPDGSGDHVLNGNAFTPGGGWTADGKWLLLDRAFVGYGYSGPELFEVATGMELPLIYASTRTGAAFRR
jgi:Tol biopolymer transport system component